MVVVVLAVYQILLAEIVNFQLLPQLVAVRVVLGTVVLGTTHQLVVQVAVVAVTLLRLVLLELLVKVLRVVMELVRTMDLQVVAVVHQKQVIQMQAVTVVTGEQQVLVGLP